MLRKYAIVIAALAAILLLPIAAQADPITYTGTSTISQTRPPGYGLIGASLANVYASFAQIPQSFTLIIGDVQFYADPPGTIYNSTFKVGLTFTDPSSLVLPVGIFEFIGVGTQESGVLLTVTQPGPQTILLGGDIYEINFYLSQMSIMPGQGAHLLLSMTNTTLVPEPTTIALLIAGLAGIATKARRSEFLKDEMKLTAAHQPASRGE